MKFRYDIKGIVGGVGGWGLLNFGGVWNLVLIAIIVADQQEITILNNVTYHQKKKKLNDVDME